MTVKLTESQVRHLQMAHDSGNELILDGIDKNPGVVTRVVNRLFDMGLLETTTGYDTWVRYYQMTQAGKDALAKAREDN